MREESLAFIDRQVGEFRKARPVYVVFAKVLELVMAEAAKDLGMVAIVQSRPKDVASFVEKCFRKQHEMDLRGKGERRAFVHSFTDLCGARVIVEYKDQIGPVGAFIRRNFEIDEANSVDTDVLGTSTFAYRPVHLIVSMKEGAFPDVLRQVRETGQTEADRAGLDAALRQLTARRTQPEEPDGVLLAPGPLFKAEVQVRTLVEHAWSNLNHDRIYKGDVELPLVLKRDMNRISAVLEEADEDFARVVRSVDNYRTYRGKHLPDKARAEEVQRLRLTLRHAPDRTDHARWLAKLESEMRRWDEVIAALRPIVEKWLKGEGGRIFLQTHAELQQATDGVWRSDAHRHMGDLRDSAMSAVMLEYGWAKWQLAADPSPASPRKKEARQFLEYSGFLDGQNAEARIRLGMTFESQDRPRQLRLYEQAFQIAPEDPTVLGEFLLASIRSSQNLTGVPSLRGSLLRGIETCQHWASVDVCLPLAYFRLGFFQLLLEQGQAASPSQEAAWSHPDLMRSILGSLAAYAKAAELSDFDADIVEERRRIANLRGAVGFAFPGAEWVDRLLLLEIAGKAWAESRRCREEAEEASEIAAKEGNCGKADEAAERARSAAEKARETAVNCLGQDSSADCPRDESPIVVFVGGCGADAEETVAAFKSHIDKAVECFQGTVFCGGTDAGVSGIVGAACSRRTPFRKVAYVRNGPHVEKRLMEKSGEREGYELRFLDGDGYTPMETLQMWTDLLASGIDPGEVIVVGINGGGLSAFELRLALSLGARVGVVRQSGGAAKEILDDPVWRQHERLLPLPDDVQTVKALVIGRSASAALGADARDRIAQVLHDGEAVKRRQRHAAQPDRAWQDLDPFFKRSVLGRIDYWDRLLEAVGMRIVNAEMRPAGAEIVPEFTQAELRVMAEMEHARWNVERLSGGQRYGKEKRDKHTHPDIVPWGELSQAEQQKDIDYVSQMLRVGEFGYCVVRGAEH